MKSGDATFWQNGKLHEIDTNAGLSAFIIENEKLDPATFMH